MAIAQRIATGLMGASGLALSAFGAHSLKGRLSDQAMEWYKTGAQYHLIGAVALLALLAIGPRVKGPFWTMLAGILVFAGSLYALAFTEVRIWGAVTPIGGALQIAAWLWIAVGKAEPATAD